MHLFKAAQLVLLHDAFSIRNGEIIVDEGYSPPTAADLAEIRVLVEQPTAQDINLERSRRIIQGNLFTLSSGKQVRLLGDDKSNSILQGLAFASQMRISMSAGDTVTLFRDGNDNVLSLTQYEVVELWSVGASYVSDVMQASWSLKDGEDIPSTFKDAVYWPDVHESVK